MENLELKNLVKLLCKGHDNVNLQEAEENIIKLIDWVRGTISLEENLTKKDNLLE